MGFARRFRRAANVQESELIKALEKHNWQLAATAVELGVSRPTLYRLIEACPKIRKASDLGQEEIVEAIDVAKGSVKDAAVLLKVSLSGLKRRMHQLHMVV